MTVRQRPGTARHGTANGVVFLMLEDETRPVIVIVWASVFERFRKKILSVSHSMGCAVPKRYSTAASITSRTTSPLCPPVVAAQLIASRSQRSSANVTRSGVPSPTRGATAMVMRSTTSGSASPLNH